MRQRRLFFQGSERGVGRVRLVIPINITRSYSCKSPTLRERNTCSSTQRRFLPMLLRLMNVDTTLPSEKWPDTMKFFVVKPNWSAAQFPHEGGGQARQGRKFAWCPTHLTTIYFSNLFCFHSGGITGRGGLKGLLASAMLVTSKIVCAQLSRLKQVTVSNKE